MVNQAATSNFDPHIRLPDLHHICKIYQRSDDLPRQAIQANIFHELLDLFPGKYSIILIVEDNFVKRDGVDRYDF